MDNAHTISRFNFVNCPPVLTFHEKFVAIDSPITYIDQGQSPFHAALENRGLPFISQHIEFHLAYFVVTC